MRSPRPHRAGVRPLPPATRAIDAHVGGRLRALRIERRLRLQQIAARTGLSIGFVSQIERGISSPSLAALTRLADALDVSLAQLFDTPRATAGNGETVLRAAARGKLTAWRSGISKQLLTADPPARFSFYLMTMEPAAGSGSESYAHEGEEAGLVLQGRLRLTVGDRTWTLARGDSFHFASDHPHRFENAARGKTVIVMLNLRHERGAR